MQNDMPNKRSIVPGDWINSDVEAMLNLQLQARGVNLDDVEDIAKRLVPHLDLHNGIWIWKLDGKPVLTFQRQMVSECVIGYTITIERLIQPVSNLKLVH